MTSSSALNVVINHSNRVGTKFQVVLHSKLATVAWQRTGHTSFLEREKICNKFELAHEAFYEMSMFSWTVRSCLFVFGKRNESFRVWTAFDLSLPLSETFLSSSSWQRWSWWRRWCPPSLHVWVRSRDRRPRPPNPRPPTPPAGGSRRGPLSRCPSVRGRRSAARHRDLTSPRPPRRTVLHRNCTVPPRKRPPPQRLQPRPTRLPRNRRKRAWVVDAMAFSRCTEFCVRPGRQHPTDRPEAGQAGSAAQAAGVLLRPPAPGLGILRAAGDGSAGSDRRPPTSSSPVFRHHQRGGVSVRQLVRAGVPIIVNRSIKTINYSWLWRWLCTWIRECNHCRSLFPRSGSRIPQNSTNLISALWQFRIRGGARRGRSPPPPHRAERTDVPEFCIDSGYFYVGPRHKSYLLRSSVVSAIF